MSFAERSATAKLRSDNVSASLPACLNRRTFAAVLVLADVGLLFAAEMASGLAGKPLDALSRFTLLAVPAVVICSLAHHGCYNMADKPSPRAVLTALVSAAGLVSLAACVVWAFDSAAFPAARGVADSSALLAFVALTACLLLTRSTLWNWARPHVLSQLPDKAALIVGAESAPPELVHRLRRQFGLGSIVAAGPTEQGWREAIAMAHRGAIDTACVIVSQSNAETIGHTLASLSSLPVPVKLIFDTGFGTVLSRELPSRSGLAVFHISEPPLTDGARIIKRAEDIIFGGLLLLLFMPLMLAAAIAIKVESRGPVLFRQPRYGHNNRVIEVLKFRTMYHNMEDKHAAQQTERGDPRVTRVGAFLRRHSLDELPQLLNVMSGSMSLIGPRPHALGTTVDGHGLESVVSNYYARHQIKPGITGWAQVSGWRGNLDSVEKAIQRVEHDLYYIENWSLTFDLWIILKTLGVVLWDKEAF